MNRSHLAGVLVSAVLNLTLATVAVGCDEKKADETTTSSAAASASSQPKATATVTTTASAAAPIPVMTAEVDAGTKAVDPPKVDAKDAGPKTDPKKAEPAKK